MKDGSPSHSCGARGRGRQAQLARPCWKNARPTLRTLLPKRKEDVNKRLTGDRALVGLKLPEESSAGAPGDRRPGLGRTAGPGSSPCPGPPVPLTGEEPGWAPALGVTVALRRSGNPCPRARGQQSRSRHLPGAPGASCNDPTSRPSHTPLLPCHPARPVSGPPPVTRAPPLGCSAPEDPLQAPPEMPLRKALLVGPGTGPHCWNPRVPAPRRLDALYPVLHCFPASPSEVGSRQGPGQVWHSSHIPTAGWESGASADPTGQQAP